MWMKRRKNSVVQSVCGPSISQCYPLVEKRHTRLESEGKQYQEETFCQEGIPPMRKIPTTTKTEDRDTRDINNTATFSGTARVLQYNAVGHNGGESATQRNPSSRKVILYVIAMGLIILFKLWS